MLAFIIHHSEEGLMLKMLALKLFMLANLCFQLSW